jgi:hypothetical protein
LPTLPLLSKKPITRSPKLAAPETVPTVPLSTSRPPSSTESQEEKTEGSIENPRATGKELANGDTNNVMRSAGSAGESYLQLVLNTLTIAIDGYRVGKDRESTPQHDVTGPKDTHVRDDPNNSANQPLSILGPADAGAPYQVRTEPTKENIENLESQPYENNKVQEWAEEVNGGSNQSTYSTSKEAQTEAHLNGAATPSSHEGPSQQVTSNASRDARFQTSVQELDTVNGNAYDLSKPSADPASTQASVVPVSSKQDTLPTITEYLLQLATTKVWADCMIMVNAPGSQPLATYAHSLVLFRSTRLQSLVQHERSASFGGNLISLYPPREILPQALEATLRFLYSDNIVSEDYAFPKDVAPDARQARANSLDYILSYWVAAVELGLPPVATRAVQLLEAFIGWDVAELAMKEAEDIVTAALQIGEDRLGDCDYYGVAAKLRQVVLRFVSRQINTEGFKLELESSPSLTRSRFALLEDHRTRQNPALASMVFGSMPSSADLSPSSPQSEILPIVSSVEDQTASNILLNLDFTDLEYFCTQLLLVNGTAATQVISDIVNERERRRIKVISNRAIPSKLRIGNSAVWNVAAFREYVHDGTIQRERVGFLLPTKSK